MVMVVVTMIPSTFNGGSMCLHCVGVSCVMNLLSCSDRRLLVIGVGAGVIAIILLLVICLCCCCCCLCCRRKRNKYTASMRTVSFDG